MQNGELIVANFEIQTIPVNPLCGQNVDFLNVKHE
jgi:hypothetical protein